MTIEDRLRHALARRADAVVPSQPQWSSVADRIEPRARRRQRLAVVSTVMAALAVVVAVVLSVARSDDAARPLRTAGPATTPGTAGAPVATSTPAVPASTAPTAATAATATTSTTVARIGPAGGPVPAGFRPVSTTWISARQGWALGTAPCAAAPCTSLLRTIDGGATWAGVPAPHTDLGGPGSATGVGRVRFADDTNGWIFGPELWATHDGGSTWHRADATTGATLSLEASGGEVFAVAGATPAHVFVSEPAVDGWRQLGPDDVAPGATLALRGAAGFVQGADGVVRALSAGGLERRGAPCGANPATAVAAAGADVAAVCVSDAGAGSSTKTLVVSHDGARTWATTGNPPRGGQPSGLAAASMSTFVVAANSGASLLYRSDDGGATWTTVHTDTDLGGAGFVDLGFTDASRGVAVEGSPGALSRLLATTDGGRTWSPVTFGP